MHSRLPMPRAVPQWLPVPNLLPKHNNAVNYADWIDHDN
jgi:hypothetical protein